MTKCTVFVSEDLKSGHVSYPGMNPAKAVWWRFNVEFRKGQVFLNLLPNEKPTWGASPNDIKSIIEGVEKSIRDALMLTLAGDSIPAIRFEVTLKNFSPYEL